MLGGSALVVVSERLSDQRLLSRGGMASDADGTTTFPGGLLFAEWTVGGGTYEGSETRMGC